MIHYHGTPITPRERLYELAGRHFCVSAAEPRDVKVCHEIGQSVMLDNGAFSFWRKNAIPEWDGVLDWMEPWLDYPTSWAVIPDVINGSEEENDRLLVSWFARRMPPGAPVWHIHESFERLRRLVSGYDRVCFGSSAEFATIGTDMWHRRISAAFDVIANTYGRVPWIHMLRGLDLAGSIYPFASADSTNLARNFKGSWSQRPYPIAMRAAEIDAIQCPGRWHHYGSQQSLEVTA
jgi:hypothetical protein